MIDDMLSVFCAYIKDDIDSNIKLAETRIVLERFMAVYRYVNYVYGHTGTWASPPTPPPDTRFSSPSTPLSCIVLDSNTHILHQPQRRLFSRRIFRMDRLSALVDGFLASTHSDAVDALRAFFLFGACTVRP